MTDNDDTRWLIVGLGNPGPKYRGNRHNVGFMVVDALNAGEQAPHFRNSARFKGDLALSTLGRVSVVFLKPQTYMNLSGESAGTVSHFYRIPVERIVAIHDDVDLEFGRIKIKQGGGDGGHNGLRSLSGLLGSPEYFRVRVGVGRPRYGEVADFVLKDFCPEEHQERDKMVDRSAKAVRILLSRGLKEAMNRYNRPPKKKHPPAEPEAKKGEIDLESSAETD